MVKEVSTIDEFRNVIAESAQKKQLVLVDFYAPWCGPCKHLTPVLDELSNAYKDHDNIVFIKVNIDELEDLSDEYNISSIPTVKFLKNGTEIDSVKGFNGSTKDAITEKINLYGN